MAEESEKRFHAVMDKLFLPPNSSSNSSSNSTPSSSVTGGGGFSGGGRKRSFAAMTTMKRDLVRVGGSVGELQNGGGGGGVSPVCRPWEREDLLKRLSTFKSMTWFAKPEVVSAINCARRGWINVDMDVIACESCGARLFFSTPSSWAQQQVEKAASVFSLKLNSGHKLLCPWVDNACDEKLAQFPPSSPADLVDDYKKRYAALLHLFELPVISSTASSYMSTPLLEQFLNCPPTLDESEQVSPVVYYQAQKLISLCGWEPRLLPYIVDCKDAQNTSITVYSSKSSENVAENEGFFNESEKYDHMSVILECRLCGARVGLWAFKKTQRPTEFVRLIGHAEEPNDHHILETPRIENGEQTSTGNSNVTSSSKSVLNMTIAGGPPPAEQNFRPKISLPVVGQNLRSRFSSAFESVDGDQHSYSTNTLVEATGDSIVKSVSSDQPENVDAKAIEFDPVKQHRFFCPWIASNGKSSPGWKQTLSALERQKEFVSSSETAHASSSFIEVKDPVGSVKRLLTPPSAKRKKFTHGSS